MSSSRTDLKFCGPELPGGSLLARWTASPWKSCSGRPMRAKVNRPSSFLARKAPKRPWPKVTIYCSTTSQTWRTKNEARADGPDFNHRHRRRDSSHGGAEGTRTPHPLWASLGRVRVVWCCLAPQCVDLLSTADLGARGERARRPVGERRPRAWSTARGRAPAPGLIRPRPGRAPRRPAGRPAPARCCE